MTPSPNARRKRCVLFVTNDTWYFVSHRLPIAREAIRRGMRATVAARADDTVERLAEIGCEHEPWEVDPRGTSLHAELRAFGSLLAILRRRRPDLVHLVTIKPVLYGGLLCRLLRVPACVYAIAGLGGVLEGRTRRARLVRRLVGRLYRVAIGHRNACVVFQNADDRRRLLRWLGQPNLATEIVRGSGVVIDDYRVLPEPDGTPVVTMASRLLRDKGVEEFIAAAKRLRDEGRDVRFRIAGGTAGAGNPMSLEGGRLEALASDAGVELLGHRGDVPALFERSALVVLPSWREGLPKVLVEAGACGRAVVTTDVPGCRDAVEPGTSALLVPPRDDAALAAAIGELLDDPARRRRMGLAGRRLVESCMTADLVARRHLEIFERLLARA